MGRFENAEVFRDTERMCREDGRLRVAPNLRERPSNRMNSGDGDERVEISDQDLQYI